jgi:hypothetical protein
MEEHAFVAAKRPCEEHQRMECSCVKFNAVWEDHHGTEDTIRETCALGSRPLGLVLEKVRQNFQAHDL